MRQSNLIFAAILFAFIIYITIRGQLPAYLDLFRGRGNSAVVTSAPSNSSNDKGNKSGSSVDTALKVFDKFSTMWT